MSFSAHRKVVPSYILNEPKYAGGVSPHFKKVGENFVVAGWCAQRWNPAVAERFHKLLEALGKEFDGKISGVNLPETALAVDGGPGNPLPAKFTPDKYRNSIIGNMRALKKAFPRSLTVQYANFMPGEWRPSNDRGYLQSIYAAAVTLGVGVGGPDVLPFKKGLMDHGYHFISNLKGDVSVAMAVQEGNYKYVNPQTERKVKV